MPPTGTWGAPSAGGVLNDAHAAFDITTLKQLMAE